MSDLEPNIFAYIDSFKAHLSEMCEDTDWVGGNAVPLHAPTPWKTR